MFVIFIYLFIQFFTCDGKAESSVSHDPLEIIEICWFIAQLSSVTIAAQLLKMVLIIISVDNNFWCLILRWKLFWVSKTFFYNDFLTISKGSWDTEDSSYDAENSALTSQE